LIVNQFYTPKENIGISELTLTAQEAKHAAKVLRKGIGETIFVTDGAGTRYTGIIESVRSGVVHVSITKKEDIEKPSPEIILALGLIKKRDRLEFAIEKATELGITSFRLFRGDHSEPFKVRSDRAEAAVQSAMKQSLRVWLPQIRTDKSLDELLDDSTENRAIVVADQQANTGQIEFPANIDQVLLVVGPEGGFSERERELLKRYNATGVSLGSYRLRAETAAVVMAERFAAGS